MPTYKKFPDFAESSPQLGDFYVGYKQNGSEELRTTLSNIITYGLNYGNIFFPQGLGGGSVSIGLNESSNQLSNYAFAQGDGHIASGFFGAAFGSGNTVRGDASVAMGDSNSIDAGSERSFVAGYSNQINNASNSWTGGEGNVAYGNYNFVTGQNNQVILSGNSVRGYKNIVTTGNNHVEGYLNRVGIYDNFDLYVREDLSRLLTYVTDFVSLNNKYQVGKQLIVEYPAGASVRGNTYVTTICAVCAYDAGYHDPVWDGTSAIFITDVLPNELDGSSPWVWGEPRVAIGDLDNYCDIQHAEGIGNIAASRGGHTEGYLNNNYGLRSHVEGSYNSINTIGDYSHVQGTNNTCAGSANFVGGINSTSLFSNTFTFNADPSKTFRATAPRTFNINAPGGVVLSGGNTSVEGLVVKKGNNIVAELTDETKNSIYGGLSASTLFGYGNSAGFFYRGLGIQTGNAAASINGLFNYINSGSTDINGAYNFVYCDLGRVSGISNVLGLESGSVEGALNTVGSPFTITRILSASNTIFVHNSFTNSVPYTNTFYFRPGQVIQIDGIISSYSNSAGARANTRFTVVSSNSTNRSITVVEPLTAMVDYRDDQPFTDLRYVVGVQGRNSTNTTTVAGAHAEGIGNTVFSRAGHVEGEANVVIGANAHAENFGNFVFTGAHAEGQENRAGLGVMYFDSYNASTRTFQLFTNHLSAHNSMDLPLTPSSTLYFVNEVAAAATRRKVTRFLVLSSDPELSTVTAVSAVFPQNIDSLGTSFVTRRRQLLASTTAGAYTHAEGIFNNAKGIGSHAEGTFTIAQGSYSHAAGVNATAKQDFTYAWSSNDGAGPQNGIKNAETTRTGQYMVSAHGGMFIPGKVGIGTDSIQNALTVNGTISATTITADNISYNDADFNTLPTYKTYQTNVAVKNANWPAVSAVQLAEINYFNNQGTFAMPGALLIKGHSPDYSTSLQNLPGKGTYGLWLQNVDNMDPGTTFASDGRAQVTHAMSFRAGINNFTAGSDHNHVQWQGAPSNNTQAWQMTNGGNNGSVYGYQFPYSNRFMVHTLPQYQISTSIAAVSGFFDTQSANLGTDSDRLTGVKIIVDAAAGAGNYGLITVGEVVGITLNPGLVGLAAVIYETQCTLVSSNNTGTLSTFQFDFFIGNGTNWNPAFKGIQAIDLKSRAQGGNPGVNQITSQIGTPNTHYIGLTGSYRGMNKHCLARFTTGDILTGFKPGSPLTLWVPKSMPSSSPIGSGFITSDKISTFALGTFPTGVRSGYFDAYVINISGGDMEFALCNLMDSYSFENRTWPISAAGNAGWLLYGGTQDTVHRPTFGTTGFYFEREAWSFTGPNYHYLSGGMVKCVGLGNSEVYGDFSYGLGFRGAVLGKKSGTFAGDYNAVFGDNSVAIGGSNLISISGNQVVIGTFNDPNTNSLFVVGSGTSDTNRRNVFEVKQDGSLTVNSSALSSNGVDTFLKLTSNGINYGIKLQLI